MGTSHDKLVLGDGVAFGGRVRVSLVPDYQLFRQVELLLVCAPDVNDGFAVLGVGGPHSDLIPLCADVNYSAAHVAAERAEALTDDTQQRLQPEAVQLGVPLLLGQRDEPASTTLVASVFPHGHDAVPEHSVIAARRQLARRLHVVEQRPEVLHRVKLGDDPKVVLPHLALVVLVEPEHPAALQWVFDMGVQHNDGFPVLLHILPALHTIFRTQA